MRKYLFVFLLIVAAWLMYEMKSSDPWLTDFEMAKAKSKSSNKPILLYFSGSDWCAICMKVKKDILDTKVFSSYANNNLVLLLADFPRMKKNRLPDELAKQNEELAEKYNPDGGFPYILLLDSEGEVIKEWKGNPDIKPESFIEQIKACKGKKHL